MNCNDTRDLMLDHLYGALEDEQSDELREHVGRCEACRDALDDAMAQQGLLAEAARLEAPDLDLSAPADRPRGVFGASASPARRRSSAMSSRTTPFSS
ncbi:MAG: anti-sigma factor family protein [Planctomycetota bacterium]|jgi:predicted anti-sigma-YlaC factor YlaD